MGDYDHEYEEEWIEEAEFVNDDDGDVVAGSTEIAVDSVVASLINKPTLTANDLMRIPFARQIMREEWNGRLAMSLETPVLNFLRKAIADCVYEGVEPFLYADIEYATGLLWDIICFHITPRYSTRVFQENPELMRSMVSDIRRALVQTKMSRAMPARNDRH